MLNTRAVLASAAKVKWLKKGDTNTSYFYKMAWGRKRGNFIGSLMDDGVEFRKAGGFAWTH